MSNSKVKKRSLTKTAFRMMCLGVFTVVAVTLLVIVGELYTYFTKVHYNSLEHQAKRIAQSVEKYGISFLSDIDHGNHDVMLLDEDGNVLFDTTNDEVDKAEREAFLEAKREGISEGTKLLPSLTERYAFSAYRLTDGRVVILSEKQLTFFSPIAGFIQRIIVIAVGAFVLSFILAKLLAARIVKPINNIDMSEPLKSDTYTEIMPLIEQIESQQSSLRRKQIEFEAATENMREGMVITGVDQHIISMNKAAAEIFSIDRSNMSHIKIADTEDFGYLFKETYKGNSGELSINVGGENYVLSASPVFLGNTVIGSICFIFGLTEREKAEKMQREFTANVSHELKTPIQSISGYAELLKNGMVQSEDVPKFGERIYSEASRLAVLIEDILKLSKLDEGAFDHQTAKVDLLDTARRELQTLGLTPAAKDITIITRGDNVVILCYPMLVNAIIHNLCENAIKYNRPGGTVTVTVTDGDEEAVLCVHDTGIGIPPEHIDRIFERFYCVDKSRSKQVGGTGLGLAIVKHAVSIHGAKVSLESTPDIGTTVTVSFPKKSA